MEESPGNAGGHAVRPPSRRRPFSSLLAVLATVAFLLPALWAGTAAASEVRSASNGERLEPPAASAYCSAPGVVCITGDQTSRITVTTGNQIIDGQGHSAPGITVNADNVTVQNFTFTNCAGNCVWTEGANNAVQDNTISQVYYAGDDIDGLRFFGDGAKILRNRFFDILKGAQEDAHLDCMQTYATPRTGGGSAGAVIADNHCEDPNFHQCLMVEGPRSSDGGGGGGGVTRDWVIERNYFRCYANQTIALRDAHDFVIQNNTFAGAGRKAVQQTDGSSGITIRDNVLGSGYGRVTGD
ncbi:right-handed parallel beta-helix repeat-containing protein [Pseudonocardia adelaidensis]|uniref:Parallel beta helix pectate lyase-like protein n=1 Tax=Pseudonocardia adelaidensis TaxID=648754 RepID=A0ABP9N8K2_9PSEU